MIKSWPALQEEKIAALQSFADQLIGADHYAKPEIFSRCNEVLDRLKIWDFFEAHQFTNWIFPLR